jgi:hypothetical protein
VSAAAFRRPLFSWLVPQLENSFHIGFAGLSGDHARNMDTLIAGEVLPHSRYARGVEVSSGSASIRSTTASDAIRDHHHPEIDPRRNNHEIKVRQ